jgi:catechol 2,3-dioxygenase-like lactoylglutathione lyase family enzyme
MAYGSPMTEEHSRVVHQLRVVVQADAFDEVVRFYRDGLGLPELASFQGAGDARVIILDAGRATLELANRAQVTMIDAVEVGESVSPHIRLAFEVDDTAHTTEVLIAAGAVLVAPPIVTPWKSLNSRLTAPAGLQLTLFQEQECPANG